MINLPNFMTFSSIPAYDRGPAHRGIEQRLRTKCAIGVA
jgi:hypothetical protein